MQEKEIRWKTSFLLLSIYLCFFIFSIGCDHEPVPPDFNPDPEITPGDISDKLIARIYFDATLSMQGFVVPDSTHYTRICPSLESVIVSGWKDERVSFFRFGEKVEPIDRNTYLQAGYEGFYERENIYRETFIQKIIDYESQLASNRTAESTIPEELTEIEDRNTPEETTETVSPIEEVDESREKHQLVVIVTDLFQDRGDINLLVTQLKEKYIKNGLEIGLFGLRSQFDGTVYDTGIGQAPLPYRSDPNNPETFRPFYLLVLGRHADIAYYFDRLKVNNPDAKTIIFSRYLVSRLVSFEDATTIELERLNPLDQNPRLKRFRIVGDSDPAEISAKLKYVPLPHAMFFDSNAFKVSISAKDKRIGETKENPEAAECLEVTSKLNEDGNELSVVFSLDPEDLQPATYLYEVTLSPDVDAYQTPRWCSDWDMGAERNGAKTLNLVNFVRDLSQVSARMHHPKIAQFHCYIKKR